ncbi:MAG: TerB family tellurite resistance protein [bacterium]
MVLLIIFGIRGITTTPETGQFFCPSCETDRIFYRKVVRNWFTLYFIPLIPLGRAGEYVECDLCLKTYEAEVLSLDRVQFEAENAEFQAEFQKALQDVMILIMLADGKELADEKEMILSIYSTLSGEDLDEDKLRQNVDRVKAENLTMPECLKKYSGVLNGEGKELVYKAALMVAVSDGEYHEDEEKMMKAIARDLDISKSEVNEIHNDMME